MDGHGKRNQPSWKKVQLLAAPRNFQKHLQPHINNKVNFLKKSTCHRCSTCAHVMDVAHSALRVVGNRITQTGLKRNAWKTLCLRKFEFGELATFCIPDPSTTFGFNQHTHTRCSSPTCRLSAEEHWSGWLVLLCSSPLTRGRALERVGCSVVALLLTVSLQLQELGQVFSAFALALTPRSTIPAQQRYSRAQRPPSPRHRCRPPQDRASCP
jgi:hypothetical protein